MIEIKNRFLSLKEVTKMADLTNTTLIRQEKKGAFPSRRTITNGRVGWLESEVLQWMEDRPKLNQPQDSIEINALIKPQGW